MTVVSAHQNGLQFIGNESTLLPFRGFYYASDLVVSKAKENKATLLYTVPFSVVINTASTVLGVLVGVVKLIATPIFLAMALVHCSNKEKAGFWLKRTSENVVSAVVVIVSPLIALVCTIVPHKTLEWGDQISRGN